MANEFQHKDPGSALTQAEYITTDGTGHIFDCQATGDILYASSATVLKNLGKGAANTILSIGGSCIPAWTASPSVTDLTIGGGCITLSAATDIDLLDNNASALSFDASGKTGIIDIVTTNCSEGVTMSGTLGVTGVLTANAGVVVDNFTLDGTELDLSSGDFTLDVAGDIEVNADGGCINFKDASLALAAIVNTSCVGELRIHEAANYIGLKPPALSANQTWTWPAAKGCCGEVLTCDGCGVLSWAAAGGGCVVCDTSPVLGGSLDASCETILNIGATGNDIDAGGYNAINACAGAPSYSFTCDTDIGMYRFGANALGFATGGQFAVRMQGCGSSSKICINECANGALTKGININQAGFDCEIFNLKSSDVTHGITAVTETDTYGMFKKHHANGGLAIRGLNSNAGPAMPGLLLVGYNNNDVTTAKNNCVSGYLCLRGYKGTGVPVACANVVGMRAGCTALWFLDTEGDVHYDGTTNEEAFDTYCDVALLTAARGVVMPECSNFRQRFSGFIDEHAQLLNDTGVITLNDDGHHFISTKGLNGLVIDSIRQMHGRVQSLESQLRALQEGK